jgi:hypothetical protein
MLNRACLCCACLCHLGLSQQPKQQEALNNTLACRWDGRPIWWMKAPKTASTFANILVRAVCPHAHIKRPLRVADVFLKDHGCYHRNRKIAHLQSGHNPLPPSTKGRSTAIVTILREPTSRIVSGYFHNLHDCVPLKREVHITENSDIGLFRNQTARALVYGADGVRADMLLRYARCVSACQTRMLIGMPCGMGTDELLSGYEHSSIDRRNVSSLRGEARSMVGRALERVRRDVAFIGVTERFTESVRSLSAFLQVPVLPRIDYANTRPSFASHELVSRGKALLGSFAALDVFVYQAASEQLSAFKRQCHVSDR